MFSIPHRLSVLWSQERLFLPCHLCGPAVLGILVTLGAQCIPGGPLALADPVETTYIQFPRLIAMNEHFQSCCFGNHTLILKELFSSENIICNYHLLHHNHKVTSGKERIHRAKRKKLLNIRENDPKLRKWCYCEMITLGWKESTCFLKNILLLNKKKFQTNF